MRSVSLAVLLFITTLVPSLLWAASPAEDDHFAYIVELYYASDDYLNEVKLEIDSFRNQYPESDYLTYIDYIRANVALKQGQFDLADSVYASLLGQNLPLDVLADIYLNYGLTKYFLGDYPHSLELLNSLITAFDQPYYLQQAHIWKGRIFALQGYYLSAKREYQTVQNTSPEEIKADYYRVLLALDREEEARDLIASLDVQDPEFRTYRDSWLAYLLDRGYYAEFDSTLATLPARGDEPDSSLDLLRVRRLIIAGRNDVAKDILDGIEDPGDLGVYYRAILLRATGLDAQADLLFKSLLTSPVEKLPLYSYLERIKILFGTAPESALSQLETFLKAPAQQSGEAFSLLGELYFRRQNYSAAARQFSRAAEFPLNSDAADKNSDLLAESLWLAGEKELGAEYYNRYLNLYPSGRYRAKAMYYLGLGSYQQRDFALARSYLERSITEEPNSPWSDPARFYLAEILFQSEQYSQAADLYNSLADWQENASTIQLRIAQCAYYQGQLSAAEAALATIPDAETGFEPLLLKGAISFSRREFDRALAVYQLADSLAATPVQKTEAKAYQAYTLLYLRRFEAAADLYFNLSRDSLNADVYLYQAALAAGRGDNWQRALSLYDRFLDEFPDSPYLQSVLADIATTLFNLGRYDESFDDWINILRRFTANTFVTEDELAYLSEVFTGLELSCRRLDDPARIGELAEFIDNFNSDYIKFELEFIIVKLYADAELWDDVLRSASDLRASLNLPGARRNSLELLMAQSLINLDQWGEADSLLAEINSVGSSAESLVRWGDLAALEGNGELALERYRSAYALDPDSDLWVKMLEISSQNDYVSFPDIWDSGKSQLELTPEAYVFRLRYLMDTAQTTLATSEADSLLAVAADRTVRAQAEIVQGRIAYNSGTFTSALRIFRKVRLLYKDFPEQYAEATYHYVLTLIQLGAGEEARLTLDQELGKMTSGQVSELELLLAPRE